MNVKVLIKFVDKYDFSKTHNPGDIIDNFDEARITDLVSRGLVEVDDKKEVKDEDQVEKKVSKKVSK